MIKYPIISILYLLFLLVLLTGCYDKNQLEEMAFVVAIGLDLNEEGKISATFQISNPEVGTSLIGSSPPSEKPEEIITIEANDFLTARNTANAFASRKLTFSQTMALIVSEDLARSDKFIKILYSSIRERELRKQVAFIVSKEKAEDFIRHNKQTLETRPHKYYSLMLDRTQKTGLIPPADILQYFQTTESDADLFLAMYATTEEHEVISPHRFEDEYLPGQIPRKGGPTAQFIGSAVFRQGKMIGSLTGQETRAALMMDNTLRIEDMLVTYPDPLNNQYRISARVSTEENYKIKLDLSKATPRISIHLPVDIEVLAIPSLINYSTNLKKQEILRKSIENDLNKKFKKLIQKTQEEFKGEPFHWSLEAQRHFLTMKDYENFNWMNTYPRMEIDTNISVKITEFGQQIQSPDLNAVED